jgi:sugar phosphate isomerase/epimerase
MQIGISNIGWDIEDVRKNTDLALALGFDYIESAYIKAPLSQAVYAIQGVFYQSGITLFSDSRCYDYLCGVVDYCLENEVKIVTLGSPAMRTGSKNDMLELLKSIDSYINKRDCIICIEPNARKYGGEYYYSLDEIVYDIKDLNNIKTMIDTGNLEAEGFDPIEEFKKYSDFIYHCHVSTTTLGPLAPGQTNIKNVEEIKRIGYNKNITYEYTNSNNIEEEMKYFLNLIEKA